MAQLHTIAFAWNPGKDVLEHYSTCMLNITGIYRSLVNFSVSFNKILSVFFFIFLISTYFHLIFFMLFGDS